MTTANIIMAIALIVLMAVAVLLIVRYSKKLTEIELKAQELDQQEKGLTKRQNTLDKWCADLKDEQRRQDEWLQKRKHIYANYEVLDSAESKPSAQTIGKSLSSKIGYALRHEFPDIAQRHDNAKGGRTVYSVDFYVTPYETV